MCPLKLQNETTNSTKFLPTEEANLPQNVNLAEEMNLEIIGKTLHKQKDTRIFATVPQISKTRERLPRKSNQLWNSTSFNILYSTVLQFKRKICGRPYANMAKELNYEKRNLQPNIFLLKNQTDTRGIQ